MTNRAQERPDDTEVEAVSEADQKPLDLDGLTIDGGMSTALDQQGCDVSTNLWTAQLLLDDPAQISAAHRRFVDAGAEVVITSSYQCSVEGFLNAGTGLADAKRLVASSVSLARDAVGNDALVAASIGPYAAVLADGSEYTAATTTSLAAMAAMQRDRLEPIIDAGPDLLAIETIPSILELAAVADALHQISAEYDGLATPAWVSFTVTDEGDSLRSGEPLADAVAVACARVPSLVAVGINCCSPDAVDHALEVIDSVPAAEGVVRLAYPNSGQEWNAIAREWTGEPRRSSDVATLRRWRSSGLGMLGGCCGVGPEAIAVLANAWTQEIGARTAIKVKDSTDSPRE